MRPAISAFVRALSTGLIVWLISEYGFRDLAQTTVIWLVFAALIGGALLFPVWDFLRKVWAVITQRGAIPAYVFLEVEAPKSYQVADDICAAHSDMIDYAATVWGQWDVILHLKPMRDDEIGTLLEDIAREQPKIRHTETFIPRRNQIIENPERPNKGRLAFILFRSDPGSRIGALVDLLRNIPRDETADSTKYAQLVHAAGVFGRFDVIATVRYDDDQEVDNLVMGFIQERKLVTSSLSIFSQRNRVYPLDF